MKDHQLGYVPDTLEGPLGTPRRVLDEYDARARAIRKAHIDAVNREYRINEVRVYWVHMQASDSEGLIARGVVNPKRVKQIEQPKYEIRGQGKAIPGAAPRFVNPFDVYATNFGMQAQAQQQAHQDVQNAYTDGLIGQIRASLTGPPK